MITDSYLKWVVTVAFAVSAVFWVARACARDSGVAGRVTGALHVVMSLAMIAMVWPSLPGLPTWLGITVFAAAAAIFVLLLVLRADHRSENGYHAFMMATMVWMYLVMDPSIVGGTMTVAGGGSMDMGGGMAMSMPGTMSMHPPHWAGVLDLAVGLVYVVVAAVWIAVGQRTTGDRLHRQVGMMQALMAGATTVMFLSYTA